ncbi:MAG TPA: biotin--[acetyl-CoA-carboxylase] ligase [Albitalea sp.]|jgi:BirA family biotin operon repressor/biotin-[acetyl-CoA-carboxylase] ligase|nr:biotin--[acetyl-CoA-carboxylase] ligase [Albitalea sp.]
MPEHPLRWGAEALWEQLTPELPGLSVEVVARISSTNSALLERARIVMPSAADDGDTAQVRRSVESTAFGRRAADLQPCLLVAEHQTHGRGRQGRVWQAAPGASLTFSLALPLSPKDWAGLSLAVGVALAGALDPLADGGMPRLGVKWPNDLWLLDEGGGGRKLGGILIETVTAGARRLAVIGIGLNVLPLSTAEAATGFASLQELDPEVSAPQVLSRIAKPLVEALRRFERDGFAAFAGAFAPRDLLHGRSVRTTHPEVPEGRAEGLAHDGSLLVRTPDGSVKTVASGEVSVRLQQAGEPPC